MTDVRALVVFKRHPDRMPGTWWPLKEKGGTTLARLACPTCGELIFVRQTVHRIKADGTVNAPICCAREACWVGRVRLDRWEA